MNARKTSVVIDENTRETQTSARASNQQALEQCRFRIRTLDQALANAQQRLSADQHQIQQLVETIAALSLENIYLYGKITRFQDSGVLSTGLHRTAELLNDKYSSTTAAAVENKASTERSVSSKATESVKSSSSASTVRRVRGSKKAPKKYVPSHCRRTLRFGA